MDYKQQLAHFDTVVALVCHWYSPLDHRLFI